MNRAVTWPAGAVAARASVGDSAERTERVVAYEGLRVRVRADQAAPVEWLLEFLAPHFAALPGDAAGADCTVSLECDAGAFAALWARAPREGAAPVDGFALDNSVVPLIEWSCDLGDRALYDEHTRTFLRFLPGARTIELLADGTSPKPRTALMRVVRELAMHRAQRDGGLFLHASAVAFAGRGLIVAGPKAAGKTSLLVHLLRQPGARYLSNDRVLARLDPEPRIVGMPTIVTLRPGMLERFPDFSSRLLASGFGHRLSFAENARRAQPIEPWSDGRFGLSPPQLCSLLDVEPISAAEPRALLFPALTHRPGAIELAPLEADDAAARLADALFGIRTWRKSLELFDFDGHPPLEDHGRLALARRLVERVPAFECRLGEDAYRVPGATAQALDRLLA